MSLSSLPTASTEKVPVKEFAKPSVLLLAVVMTEKAEALNPLIPVAKVPRSQLLVTFGSKLRAAPLVVLLARDHRLMLNGEPEVAVMVNEPVLLM